MYRQLRTRFRLMLRRLRIFTYHNLLHVDDPPHRLALGAAIGIFVALTPTIGIQTFLSLFLAWLLRANKVIGLAILWLSNPATMVPMYYFCYVVGQSILGYEAVSDQWWMRLRHPPPDWWPRVSFYWSQLMEIAAPLWLGCLVIGFLLAYVTYYGTYLAISKYRLRRWGQLIPPPLKPVFVDGEQGSQQLP